MLDAKLHEQLERIAQAVAVGPIDHNIASIPTVDVRVVGDPEDHSVRIAVNEIRGLSDVAEALNRIADSINELATAIARR